MLISMLLVCIFTLTGCGSTEDGGSVVEVINNQKVQVSFDYNFENNDATSQPINVSVGGTYGQLPEPSVEKEGCHFVGWNTRADGLGRDITGESIVSYTAGNHTLYAKWEGNTYTLSFDLGGGTINGSQTVSDRKVTYGEVYGMFAIPSNPQKYMAKFDGWFLNPEGDGTPVTMNTLVRTKGNHTLYAVFRDIRFNYDFTDPTEIKDFFCYGGGLDYQIVNGEESSYLEISNKSSRPTGYLVLDSEFTAGTTIEIDAEFVGEVGDPNLDDRDLDYSSKKVKAGMFCYGANGDGSGISSGTLGVPGAPTTPDHVNKWYWGQGARNDPWESNVWNNGHMKFTVNILEHCYGLQFYIEFGRKQVRETSVDGGIDYDTNTELWHNNKWLIHSIKINYVMPEPDLPQGTEVTVNFDLNYNTDMQNPDAKIAIAGEEIGELPQVAEREGFEFVGWNTSPDGDGKTYDAERILNTPHEEITLYAIWEGRDVKVSFDLNGGTYNGETEIMYEFVKLGESYPAEILVSPVKDGYTFGGWFLNPEGTGVNVTENTIVETVTDHTLYAIYIDKVENINCFDFTDPNHALYFQALNGLTLGYASDERGGYLEVTNGMDHPSGQIALMKPLKAGMTVDIDLEFIGTVDDVDLNDASKLKAGAFFYGAREDGWGLDKYTLGNPNDDATDQSIRSWYWGQGARNDPWEKGIWNNGHISYTINILEDCYGLSIMLEFGNKKVDGSLVLDNSLWKNNKWRINSIVISVPGIETEYGFELNGGTVDGATSLDKVQTVTGETFGELPTPKKNGYMFLGWYLNPYGSGAPVTSESIVKNSQPHTLYAIYKEVRLTYDFTTPDQVNDFINMETAGWEIVTDDSGTYLKITSTNASLNAKFTLGNIFLPAGSSVEYDVEFVGDYTSSSRAGFFLYGANSQGYNISSGALGTPGADGTPDEVNKWYWGQGYHSNDSANMWQNGKFTIKANILEDAYGVYAWAQMGSSATGYWKITAIRITLA